MRLPARAVRRLRERSQRDAGISLLEVIVALMIIAVVMTSAAGFFLNSLKTTGGASQRQSAVTLVNAELESIRAVPAGVLVTGRTNSGNGSNSIVPLFAWSGAAALTAYDDLSNSQPGAYNYDKTANASTIPAVPPITTQTVNNKPYTLHNFIDPCWLVVSKNQTPSSTSSLACGATYSSVAGSTTTMMFRITVAATWTGGAATNCTAGCSYSASSLVDPNSDPTFQSNISKPTITGISPSSVPANKTTTIFVSGAGFVSGATATVCSNASVGTINQTFNTGTSIQIPIIAGNTAGSCTLTITNPDGGNVTTTFTISNPPTITSVSPAVQNYTSGSITISGTNFGAASVTTGSGAWSGTTVTGTTTITGTYVANAPTSGSVPVTVTNSDGGTATANITVTKSAPAITKTTPTTAVAGQATTITLTGTDFAPSGETVIATGGTVSGYTYGTGFVTVTFAADGSATTAKLSVQNPDGGTSSTTNVTVTKSTPRITGISGKLSGGSILVTVTGSGLTSAPSKPILTISYYGATLFSGALTAVTNNALGTVTIPNSYGAGSGSYPVTVTVTNADGGTTGSQSLTLVLS